MNEEDTAAMLKRLQTELDRRTEIVEATNARAAVTLQEVRNLKLAVFQMQAMVHEMKRAAGIADS